MRCAETKLARKAKIRIQRRSAQQMDLEKGAYHEAGHAALARHFGFKVLSVSLSHCEVVRPKPMSLKIATRYAQAMMAGVVAYKLHEGRRLSWICAYLGSAVNDVKMIEDLRILFPKLPTVDELQAQTEELLEDIWPKVEGIAEMLILMAPKVQDASWWAWVRKWEQGSPESPSGSRRKPADSEKEIIRDSAVKHPASQ